MKPGNTDRSRLLLLRLWRPEGDKSGRWEGKVQDILSGKANSFQDWMELLQAVSAMVQEPNQSDPPGEASRSCR